MRRPANLLIAGLGLTLLGCSDRSSSPTDPVLSSPVLAVSACDVAGARTLANQLFPNNVKQIAQDSLQVIQNAGAGTAEATAAGFGILELISTYGPSSPQIGSDLANAILPCMTVGSTPTDFTPALSDTGAFAVRGSSSTDIAAVVSRDGLWGMEPPLNTTTDERYTWNAITVPANTRLLVYGARISASNFTNEQQVGTIFNWFTLPVVTFDPGVVVGTCIVDNGPQYLIQHNLLGEIVPSATISFCPVGVTSVRSAEGWSPAALAQRVFDFFSPRPLLATALGVRPPGGSVGSLSPSVAVDPGTITLNFPEQIADGKTNQVITFKGGSPVSVTVEPAGGTDLNGAVVQLIAVANLGSPVVATGNTAITNDGVAVFPNLSLNKAGGYRFITKLIGFGQNNAAGFTIIEAQSNGFNLKQPTSLRDCWLVGKGGHRAALVVVRAAFRTPARSAILAKDCFAPSSNRKAVMSLHSSLLATLLLGLGPFIAPPVATGQVPASDSAAPAASDSVQPSGAPPLPSDSVGQQTGDSAPTADTGRSSSDTIPQSGARSPAASDTATADTATAPTAPADSILSAACNGAAGGVTVARDLLVIVFAPEAGAGERAAAAESVDGRLLGLAPSGQPGAYYLQVPSGGEEHRLRTAADQLILLEMVRQVGARACPPPPLPDTTRQKSP